MSSLQYYNEEGAGQKQSEAFHYSQAVVIGDIVKCAGQGGWDENVKLVENDIEGQIELAFKNVEKVLQAVGLRGWEDVYLIRSYHVDIDAALHVFVEKMRQRLPNHKPLWTCIGVPRLALPGMLIEIEVEAYAGKALEHQKGTTA